MGPFKMVIATIDISTDPRSISHRPNSLETCPCFKFFLVRNEHAHYIQIANLPFHWPNEAFGGFSNQVAKSTRNLE